MNTGNNMGNKWGVEWHVRIYLYVIYIYIQYIYYPIGFPAMKGCLHYFTLDDGPIMAFS